MTTTAYNKNISGPITACPVCNSAVYDNTAPGAKKNPKGPDYKCKTDGDHAFWLARGATGKQPYSAGGKLPWESEQEAAQYAAPVATAGVSAPEQPDKLQLLFVLYRKCLGEALTQTPMLIKSEVGDSPEAASARAATLFVQANQRGLA